MQQHHPEAAHSGLSKGPSAPCGAGDSQSPAVAPRVHSPWMLFSLDEEFRDEDFLSALEDVESRLDGAQPRPAGRSAVSSSPGEAAPAPGRSHVVPGTPSTIRGPHGARTAPRRPLLTPGHWPAAQRPVQTDEGPQHEERGLGPGAEGPALAKRSRGAGPSACGSRAMSAPPFPAPPRPPGPCETPRPLLSPGATRAAAAPPRQVPQLPCATGNHCDPRPRNPLLPPRTWAGENSRPPGARAPSAQGPAAPGTGPAVPSGAPLPSWAPVRTPRGPCPSPHTPVVTNHLVRLVTAAARSPGRARARRFPGPAGLLPQQCCMRNPEEIMVSPLQTPAHGALAKLHNEALVAGAQVAVEEDFTCGAWAAMKAALGLDDRDPACFLRTCSVAAVLRKAALKQLPGNKVPAMAVMIKSLSRSSVDASAVLRDPTGEMQGTLHRALLEARQAELKPGAVLLLRQVGVFSPSLRNHYLNVTPSNLVRVYSPASGGGDLLQPAQPLPQDSGSSRAAQPRPGPGASVLQEEEALDDDLDRLLSELPEDFFAASGGWGHPEAGPLEQ